MLRRASIAASGRANFFTEITPPSRPLILTARLGAPLVLERHTRSPAARRHGCAEAAFLRPWNLPQLRNCDGLDLDQENPDRRVVKPFYRHPEVCPNGPGPKWP